MTARTFRLAADGDRAVVHDPCTGLTHLAFEQLADQPGGRVRLDDAEVGAWPVVHPANLNWSAPVSVCWSPVVRCNLACPHCLDDKTLAEAGSQQRGAVAEALAGSGVLGVDLSGGEPLLLGDLAALADRMTSAGIVVSVTTNGWHLGGRTPDLSGHVDAVRVSLDGHTPATHDGWRGAGSFARAVEGIRTALAHGVPVQIQMVLMASTVLSAQPLIDLAAGLGVHGLTLLQMLPIGEGRHLAGSEALSDAAARRIVAELDVPGPLRVRLRERDAADGFTVVRADTSVWRNSAGATTIHRDRPLRDPNDLSLLTRDGSA